MDDIINYTMETPNNTNPNVLRGLLENYSESGSRSDLLVVKITEGSSAHETTYVFSHTPAEVYEWITANKPAIAIMNGVIGKVYLGTGIDAGVGVICAIPKYDGYNIFGDIWRDRSGGLIAVGSENGTEWSTDFFIGVYSVQMK